MKRKIRSLTLALVLTLTAAGCAASPENAAPSSQASRPALAESAAPTPTAAPTPSPTPKPTPSPTPETAPTTTPNPQGEREIPFDPPALLAEDANARIELVNFYQSVIARELNDAEREFLAGESGGEIPATVSTFEQSVTLLIQNKSESESYYIFPETEITDDLDGSDIIFSEYPFDGKNIVQPGQTKSVSFQVKRLGAYSEDTKGYTAADLEALESLYGLEGEIALCTVEETREIARLPFAFPAAPAES